MTSAAIALLVLSAISHALWNLMGKQQPTAGFFLMVNTLGTLCFTPVLVFTAGGLPSFSPSVWGLVVLTGIFQAGYYAALAGAYSTGQLSISYPIARASAVLFVAVANAMLQRGRHPGPLAMGGMALVISGILLLPVGDLRRLHWRSYITKSSLLAVAAALGTAGYMICDDRALRLLRSVTNVPGGVTGVTVLYSWVEAISTSAWLAGLVLLSGRERAGLRRVVKTRIGMATATGAVIFFSYALVLLAMNLSRDVSYVMAFRQLSVPIGACLGILLLKEPVSPMKLLGLAGTTAGLVLVALG